MAKHECLHEEDLRGMHDNILELKGKITNGLTSRIKTVEKLQYWQMGALVMIIGALLFGLWWLTTRTLESNATMLQDIQQVMHGMGGHVHP